MSKLQSINSDISEIHDINNELYEALVDEELAEAKAICNKAIKKYREILHLIKTDLT